MPQLARSLALIALTIGFMGQVSAKEPTLQQRLQAKPTSVSFLKTVYEVQVADEVPDVAYRVEYRYLDENEWKIFSISRSEESANESVIWILLHLIAEARIVEFTPQLDWETVATLDSYSAAVDLADDLETPGVLTRVVARSVPRYSFEYRLQLAR